MVQAKNANASKNNADANQSKIGQTSSINQVSSIWCVVLILEESSDNQFKTVLGISRNGKNTFSLKLLQNYFIEQYQFVGIA